MTRRGFLRSISRWSLLFAVPAFYAIYKYLFPRPKFIPHSKRVGSFDATQFKKIIPLQDLPENSSIFTDIDDEQILLIRKNGENVSAYSAVCTHKNCKVDFRKETQDIFCECHESKFNLDGIPLNGPATEPLPKYKVRLENGNIIVSFI
jgi:nitrite reductase/ring-hydroxylating ferredoxin subunit